MASDFNAMHGPRASGAQGSDGCRRHYKRIIECVSAAEHSVTAAWLRTLLVDTGLRSRKELCDNPLHIRAKKPWEAVARVISFHVFQS